MFLVLGVLYQYNPNKIMRKILYCILLMFLCSILSCDRKRQSSEQDMKDSLVAANFMKCAKFLYSTFLAPSNLEEQEEYVTADEYLSGNI